MSPAGFRTISDFARFLEKVGQLHRVQVEVDPRLEITEIATRAIREGKPALLFEHVTGSPYPVLINTLASELRCELALHKHPQQLGEELIAFLGDALPPKPSSVFTTSLACPTIPVGTRDGAFPAGLAQEVIERPEPGSSFRS